MPSANPLPSIANPIRRHGRCTGNLVSAVFLAAGCSCTDGDSAPRDPGRDDLAPAVEVVRTRHGAVPLEERIGGVVRAENQTTISAEISAPIREVLVRDGDAVRRGQLLVRLVDDALRDQLRQAEANVRLAEAQAAEAQARAQQFEAQMRRAQGLSDRELLSPAEVEVQAADLAAARAGADQAGARVEQARAVAEERRTLLAQTIVRAPVSGRVGRRDAEPGAITQPGSPLFVIGDLDRMVVEVPLTEKTLGFAGIGQPVRITAASLPDLAIPATLSRVSPFLAASSFSTSGEIDLETPDSRLRPGMFVDVEILYGSRDEATLVPAAALWTDPRTGLRGAFVVAWSPPAAESVADSSLSASVHAAAFRALEIVAQGQGVTGVRGIEPGEWVVTVGQHLLASSGTDVRVRATTWERVLDLQSRQREDLLRAFLDKQQRAARTRGVRPPTSAEYLSGSTPATRNGTTPH